MERIGKDGIILTAREKELHGAYDSGERDYPNNRNPYPMKSAHYKAYQRGFDDHSAVEKAYWDYHP